MMTVYELKAPGQVRRYFEMTVFNEWQGQRETRNQKTVKLIN